MIRLREEDFEEMVVRCYEGLPEGLLGYLENLDIVVEEVRKTLLHEVGHYLGMDEEHLDRLGYS